MNEQEKLMVESMARDRASAEPFPGALAQAFVTPDIEVGALKVRKFVAMDYAIMRQIKSPLYEILLESQKPAGMVENVPFTTEEEWALCLQFTIPVREARALANKGREEFLKAAEERIGLVLDGGEISLIQLAVMEQYKRQAATVLKFAAQSKEKGETTFFPVLAEAPKTDSAGGSTTSAV